MKRTSEYTTEEKRNLIELGREKKIKLNGQSAVISGAKLIEGCVLNLRVRKHILHGVQSKE
jgi:hypothetical protein